MRSSRSLPMLCPLAILAILAAVVAGCGGVPGGAVVSVNGSAIKTSTFKHWLGIAALSARTPGTTAPATVPDAPSFTRCVAEKQRTAAPPPKGQPRPTAAQLKLQCKQQYESLRDQVLQFLIQARWIEGEASDLGIRVSKSAVQKEFDRERKQSFPKDADYQRFLQTSGMSNADVLLRVKGSLLSGKIRTKVTKGKDLVSQSDIAAYYAAHLQQYGHAEQRELYVVLAATKAKADQARKAIAGGQGFAAAAKRYSIDNATKSQGGKLGLVTRGQQEKALDDAVFAAKAGQLTGPVKTAFGYYVFKVTKAISATQKPLTQVQASVRAAIVSERQQKALQTFVAKFQRKWKGRTECRKGYVVQSCSNAPKPTPQAGLPPGAVQPGGGGTSPPPQQAPTTVGR